MASRDAVARGLTELRSWWQSLPDTAQLLESTREACAEYDDVEFGQAIRRLVKEHGMSWPPKLSHILAACAMAAKYRRADAVQVLRHSRDDAYCPLCGTRTLEWGPMWPNGTGRMVPRHEPGCVRAGAEAVVAAPVNMAAWPGQKPRQATPVTPLPSSGPTALGALLPKEAA